MMILWVPIPAFRRLVNHKRQIARRQENSESYWQIFQIKFITKAYVKVFWFLCPTYHISFRYITAMFRVHCHLVFFSNQVLRKEKIFHDGESIIRLKKTNALWFHQLLLCNVLPWCVYGTSLLWWKITLRLQYQWYNTSTKFIVSCMW